jgi:hypothetical protein
MSAELGDMVSEKSPPTRCSRVPLFDITDQSLTDTDFDESQYKLEEIKKMLSKLTPSGVIPCQTDKSMSPWVGDFKIDIFYGFYY